jgi:hypothetical protein
MEVKLHKPEYEPLLPSGFHPMTLSDLKTKFVDNFARSKRRPMLWKNFIWLTEELIALDLKCKLWLDGSFVTRKHDPHDIDIIVECDVGHLRSLNQDQGNFLKQLSFSEFKNEPRFLHTFFIQSAPLGHMEWAKCEGPKNVWIENFGYSFEKRIPKGIATIEVGK